MVTENKAFEISCFFYPDFHSMLSMLKWLLQDEAAEDLDAIYDTGTGNEDTDYHRAARSAEPFPALPLAETLSQKLHLLQ